MRRFCAVLLALLPALLQAEEGEAPQGEAPDKKVFGKSEEASYEGQVVVIKVGRNDLMNGQSFKFMRRTIRRANEEKARAIVFDLNTPGGFAYETKKLMSELVKIEVPSYAFVNPEAISAGALISIATDAIYMVPDSLIGDAGLVSGTGQEIDKVARAKAESYFDANVRTILKKTGYDLELVRAMMFLSDEDRVFGDIVVKKGTLLTLNAEEATKVYEGKPLFATAVVKSIEEMLEREGLSEAPLVTADPTGFERIAWWVKFASPLLILIGVGAAYVEMKAPGFGVAGLISLVAFGIFFFGNYVAGNLAGYELAAVFVLGLILLAVEIFVIPGTGVTGIAGALLVIGALLAGMIDEIDFDDFSNAGFTGGAFLELIQWPALSLSFGLLGGMILMGLAMRFLGSVPGVKWLTLNKQLAGGASLEEPGAVVRDSRVGWTGTAMTDLRPSGKGDFDGETVDVVADGSFISKGEKIRITEEDGMRVEVRKA